MQFSCYKCLFYCLFMQHILILWLTAHFAPWNKWLSKSTLIVLIKKILSQLMDTLLSLYSCELVMYMQNFIFCFLTWVTNSFWHTVFEQYAYQDKYLTSIILDLRGMSWILHKHHDMHVLVCKTAFLPNRLKWCELSQQHQLGLKFDNEIDLLMWSQKELSIPDICGYMGCYYHVQHSDWTLDSWVALWVL